MLIMKSMFIFELSLCRIDGLICLFKPVYCRSLWSFLTMTESDVKSNALKWLIVAVAPLSVLGSSASLVCIFRHSKERRNTIFHRLMIGMSIHDFLSSLAISMGPVPIPQQYNIPHSFGTQATCTLQGFMVTMINVAHYYAVAVSIYFLLIIRYKLPDRWIAKNIEPIMHGVSIIWAYTVSFMALSNDVFNPASTENLCVIDFAPPGCQYLPDVECTRGLEADRFATLASVVPTVFVLGMLVIVHGFIIFTIRARLRRNVRHTFPGQRSSRKNNKLSSRSLSVMRSTWSQKSISECLESRGDTSVVAAMKPINVLGEQGQPSVIRQESLRLPESNSDSDPPKSSSDPTCATTISIDQPHSPSTNTIVSSASQNLWSTGFFSAVGVSWIWQRKESANKRPSRRRNNSSLSQAVTQCMLYGFVYIFCLVWTGMITILSLAERDEELFTRYYWVKSRCIL
jgi:hypothetical protein